MNSLSTQIMQASDVGVQKSSVCIISISIQSVSVGCMRDSSPHSASSVIREWLLKKRREVCLTHLLHVGLQFLFGVFECMTVRMAPFAKYTL
jgi:hypothetical protein